MTDATRPAVPQPSGQRPELLEIGKRLRQARIDRDVSQPELARMIGKSKQIISAWENGISEMTIVTLDLVSKTLDVDPTWILRGDTGSPVAADMLAEMPSAERRDVERLVAAIIAREVKRRRFRRRRRVGFRTRD